MLDLIVVADPGVFYYEAVQTSSGIELKYVDKELCSEYNQNPPSECGDRRYPKFLTKSRRA